MGINVGDIIKDGRDIYFNRTTHRIDNAGEFEEEAIACGFDDATMMFLDLRIGQFASYRLETREGAFFVLTHEPRIPSHIGCSPISSNENESLSRTTRLTQIPPGSAKASSRAATLTPSP